MEGGSHRGARFITLEGPDGAGKSSQAARLGAALQERGLLVTTVREPGGTPIGEAIRALLLDPERDVGQGPLVDALLFVAARAQLVEEVIRPALAEGRIVICDRYADSTLAYQGYGSGLDLGWLASLSARATGGLAPDLTLLLDVPVETGLDRRAGGPAGERTRFEGASRSDPDFHRRVREGYLELAAAEPGRWRVIDAARDPDLVAADVLAAVEGVVARDEPIGAPVRINP